MNVSGVSTTHGLMAPDASEFAARKKNFDALQQAVESGDMSAAKTAYEAIQKDMKNAPAGMVSQGGPFAQMQNDFKKLGEALDSGESDAVKDAFTTWQKDLKQMRPHGADKNGHTPTAAEISVQLWDAVKGTFKVTA